jgi:ketosteroid isomerase-like protein
MLPGTTDIVTTMNKMKILTGCIALIGCVGNAIALTAEEAKAQVITQEKAWSDAVIHHDIAKVASILADDFVGIDGRGFVSDKAAELKEAEPPAVDSTAPQLLKEDLSDFTARIYGNTAVLNLTNTAHFLSKGKETTITYRRTTVWVRDSGNWRCVSFHGSRVLESPKN